MSSGRSKHARSPPTPTCQAGPSTADARTAGTHAGIPKRDDAAMSLERIALVADNVATAEQALREAEHELDQAITEARTDGATIPDLMEAAGRSRQGIYNALKRSK